MKSSSYHIVIALSRKNSMEKNDNPTRTIVIEGNGCRPSHKGVGYVESEIMYTLNATEIHAVFYWVDANEKRCVKF